MYPHNGNLSIVQKGKKYIWEDQGRTLTDLALPIPLKECSNTSTILLKDLREILVGTLDERESKYAHISKIYIMKLLELT